jgi:hypothetical protein
VRLGIVLPSAAEAAAHVARLAELAGIDAV